MNELWRKNSVTMKKQNRRHAQDVKRVLAMLDRPFLSDSTPAETPEAADSPGRVGVSNDPRRTSRGPYDKG